MRYCKRLEVGLVSGAVLEFHGKPRTNAPDCAPGLDRMPVRLPKIMAETRTERTIWR